MANDRIDRRTKASDRRTPVSRRQPEALRHALAGRSRAERLYQFAQAAVRTQQLDDVFAAALDAVCQALDTNRAAVLAFDERGVMRFRAWRGLSDDYRRAVEGHSPWHREAVAPEPLLVPDVKRDRSSAPYLKVFQAEAIAALAFIPLISGGRLLGKFMVYYERPHAFNEEEIELARSIGSHLASVMDRFAAMHRLQDSLRTMELFAAVLAHDLRNPIGAIVNSAQMLARQGPASAEAVTLTDRIVSSGARMSRMIEQLLDVTRVWTGRGLALQPQRLDLDALCRKTVEELRLAHPDWRIAQDSGGSAVGTWDADRLQQVLSNLIDNAGRHGQGSGPITVRIDGSTPETVSVTVHNEGAIEPSARADLFDPFRIKHQPRPNARGLGLGLFIVREIVRAHGGRLTVDSDDTAGTTIGILLPRHTA